MDNFKAFANSFQTESKLRLEGIDLLTKKMQYPQDNLKFIHVAGTNGKGSVCSFISNILIDCNMKVGKFISPNLIDVCERISINNKNITKEEMDLLLDTVKKYATEVEKETGEMVTQFEIWTAAAFLYFYQQKCDVVVLETGLGGRLDATNIIKKNIASIITRIDIDHINYLGGTIEKVAFEKAGIIKRDCSVVTINQQKVVTDILRKRADELGAPFYIADKPENVHHENLTEYFDLGDLKDLSVNLLGTHQIENASLAIKTAQIMGIDQKYIKSGIKKASNPARFEVLCKSPYIIFDGAHNPNGVNALINTIKRYFSGKRISVVYAAMADKDIDSIIKLMKDSPVTENANIFTVTVPDNPRAQKSEILCGLFEKQGFNALSCENIDKAINLATNISDVTVICGSLYLYSYAVRAING